MEKINLSDFKKEIKRQYRRIKAGRQGGYNFLGFVENRDLTPEVINLFKVVTPAGYTFYNWIKGNSRMEKFIEEIIRK